MTPPSNIGPRGMLDTGQAVPGLPPPSTRRTRRAVDVHVPDESRRGMAGVESSSRQMARVSRSPPSAGKSVVSVRQMYIVSRERPHGSGCLKSQPLVSRKLAQVVADDYFSLLNQKQGRCWSRQRIYETQIRRLFRLPERRRCHYLHLTPRPTQLRCLHPN